MPNPPIISQRHSYPGPSLPSESHIRLVHLQPGNDDMIQCELTTTTIDSAPQYEALSYTWGDPLSQEIIWVKAQGSENTQKFSVTLNCLLALKRLRYVDKPRVLWVDALAIDQSNIDEKNHQVSLMSKIYSQAAKVIIYLGESADNSDLAIGFILECDDPSPETTSLSFPKSDILMKALRDLFFRPWFTRVWVIQEVFLSAEKIVYCGEKEFSWSAMENFKHYLVNTRRQTQLPYVVSTPREREWLREGKGGSFMWKALLDSRHCEATDSRDKVYGLLPVLDSFDARLELTPRYQDTPAKIYTDCAIALLPDIGWGILAAVQSWSSTNGLPSWVPDWNVPPLRQILADQPIFGSTGFWTCAKVPGASEKPRVIMRMPDSMGKELIPVLHGYGYPIGRISKTGATYFAGQTTSPFNEWLNLVQTLDSRKSVPTTKPTWLLLESWWREQNAEFYNFIQLIQTLYSEVMETEVAEDCLPKPEEVYFYYKRAEWVRRASRFGAPWENLVRGLALERGKGDDYRLPFRDIPFHLAGEGLAPSDKIPVQEALAVCHSRRCFITDIGYFGLAPEEAEIGDQLFFCVGAGVPFVLWEVRNGDGINDFHFVGESYLEGNARHDLDLKSQPPSLYII